MDGNVIYDNNSSDRDPILQTVLNHPGNLFNLGGYANTTEQLP